jgi:hypothetical protein
MSNNCTTKIKDLCDGKTYATCVEYQTELPSFSKLPTDECISVDESLTDLYTLIGDIKAEIDVTNIVSDCITLTTPKSPKSLISQMYTKMCAMEDVITAQGITITDLTARIVAIEASPCV